MRDRLEADSNPECRVILRSSALGVILEADANLITASALFDSIKPRVCGLTSKQWAFSFSLLTAAAACTRFLLRTGTRHYGLFE